MFVVLLSLLPLLANASANEFKLESRRAGLLFDNLMPTLFFLRLLVQSSVCGCAGVGLVGDARKLLITEETYKEGGKIMHRCYCISRELRRKALDFIGVTFRIQAVD